MGYEAGAEGAGQWVMNPGLRGAIGSVRRGYEVEVEAEGRGYGAEGLGWR